MNYNEFAEKIKQKDSRFEGMDNIAVAKQVIKENPYYKDKVDFEESLGDVVQGVGRSIGQNVTFGQAPHLAGYGNAWGGVLYNAIHLKNPLKDFVKDYEQGREQYKQEQDKFSKLHPGLNFTGNAIGTLATLPVGGAVGRIPAIAKILKTVGNVRKGAIAGAGWGSAYGFGEGLSNTKGKAIDLKAAAIGLPVGAGIGAGIGAAIPGAVNLLKLGGKKFVNGVNKGIKSLQKGDTGDVASYIVPKGVSTKSIRKLVNSSKVQDKAIKENIGMNVENYQNEATQKTLEFVPTLFDKVSKEYENLPKDMFISFDQNQTSGQLLNAIKDFGFATKFMPNPKVQQEANSLVQNIIKSGRTVNNEYGITRENLQRAMQTVWEKSQKAFKDGDNAVGKLYDNLYQILKQARSTNKNIEQVSTKYADISKAKEILENALGIKFEKGANHRQVATKIIQQGRVRAGTQLDDALSNIDTILSKYPDLKGVKELRDSIDLAQVAYDFRPPSESKLLSQIPSTTTGIIKKVLIDVPKKIFFETSPQQKAKALAENLQKGRITQNDILNPFNVISAGKFTTPLNKFLQEQRIYGGKYNPIANLMRGNSSNRLKQFVNNSLNKTEKGLLNLGIVSNRKMVNDINKQAYDSFIDKKTEHLLDSYGIRHSGNKHISEANITEKDFEKIPEIISNYDNVQVKLKKNSNGDRVYFNKKLDDKNYKYIATKNKGNVLRTKNFYVKDSKK